MLRDPTQGGSHAGVPLELPPCCALLCLLVLCMGSLGTPPKGHSHVLALGWMRGAPPVPPAPLCDWGGGLCV